MRKNSPKQTTARAWNEIKIPIVCHSSRYRNHCHSWHHSAIIVRGARRRDLPQLMRRKRLSLAKRGHRELRGFAGAPLRRFLAKCRSSYHFSIWHTISAGRKCRARLTGETGCSVRKRPGMGRETCGERSDVRSWRCCHHLRLLAVTHYRRREVEGSPPSIDVRFRTRCQCRVLAWLGRPRPP